MTEAYGHVLRRSYFTMTALGKVRHLSVTGPFGGMWVPVALERVETADGAVLRLNDVGLPFPRKRGSKYVYALPGGTEVVR